MREPSSSIGTRQPPEQDPDPFTLTLAVLGAAFGGGGYLEARRQRKANEAADRRRFEGVFRNVRDGLARLQRQIERFEQFIEESGVGSEEVRFGSVRLLIDRRSKDRVRALQSEILVTASHLTKYLDELSDYLGREDEDTVSRTKMQLEEIGIVPQTYAEAVVIARKAEEAYAVLINEVGRRHDFDDESRRQ